jgi:Flp pilus assembly protein TadB
MPHIATTQASDGPRLGAMRRRERRVLLVSLILILVLIGGKVELILIAVAAIITVNTAILFRAVLGEVRYRRAVRRRVRYYASLDEAIDDHRLR